MVGIVIVSHSAKVAEGTLELCQQMAAHVPIAAAGGLPDGNIGTDFQKIYDAVQSVQNPDGVAVLLDMGSAVMTTEMVLEQFDGMPVKMVDAPIVEGAIAATVSAAIGLSLDNVIAAAEQAKQSSKLS